MDIEKLLKQSIDWRVVRYSANGDFSKVAVRLFAGNSDGIEGLLIEQYGNLVLVTLYNSKLNIYKDKILQTLNECLSEKSIIIKAREGKDTGKFHYTNNEHYQIDQILTCHEGDAEYEIHCDPRHDYGLYLDTKAARNHLREICLDKTVLNLFSYTCAFGIAAMKGKASSVTNIDPNKEYLDWAQNTADLNNVKFKKYPDTTQSYLARHIRRLNDQKDLPYDIIVVDPPAFLVGRGSERLARNLWPEWMDCLKNSGCKRFIIVINDKSLGRQKNLHQFFKDGLGEDLNIKPITQSLDVQGQGLSHENDKFYFNPAIFSIEKLS
jgi:23S rRNA G2069 N7-methylase RlmK/C1962 C5-methylase RlmI